MIGNKLRRISVNKNFLPIKVHYFFFVGALGGVIPYLTVIAKSLGITATAVGLIFSIQPFIIFFVKFSIGYLTDYFRSPKVIATLLCFITGIMYASILLLPGIDYTGSLGMQFPFECKEHLFFPLFSDEKPCILDIKSGSACTLTLTPCNGNNSIQLNGVLDTVHGLHFKPDSNFTCECIHENRTRIACKNIEVNTCFLEESGRENEVYGHYQFGVFALLSVLGGCAIITLHSISDSACYEILSNRPELFGKQRLWATFGWGFTSFLTGEINDLVTGNSEIKNYSPGFYFMIAFLLTDVFILRKLKIPMGKTSPSILKDVKNVFKSSETIVFALAIFIIGGLLGLIQNFELWFLQEEFKAPQKLLGMTIAVQTFIGEVPFFFFSGWFIKTFGHFYCLSIVFAGLSLRFILYYVIDNPWLFLPVDVLHGLTFAVSYATMTDYAAKIATPGTEVTVMALLAGICDTLGNAVGALMGGMGMDRLGGRTTFLVASISSAICFPVFAFIHLCLSRMPRRLQTSTVQME